MLGFVACITERESVANLKPKLWIKRKFLDVVRHEITSACVAAPLAGELIPKKHVVAPAFVFEREALVPPLGQFAVFVGMALLSAVSHFASALTYQRACLIGMFSAAPMQVGFTLARLAHFSPGLFRHALPLHRRYECFPALNPRLSDNFTSGEFHGR